MKAVKSFSVEPHLFSREVNIHLAGCGGNGCHMLAGLCQMHAALKGLGHPGIHVTAYDPDTVTVANLGRQLFTEDALGQNKAIALVQRANVSFGLGWDAIPLNYRPNRGVDILISCVDSKQSRAGIHARIQQTSRHYWMDLGNGEHYGQFIFGEAGCRHKLPNIVDLHPEIIDGFEENAPSCSLAEALERQDLFINRTLTAHALQLLWTVFRHGKITTAGGFVNLKEATVLPVPLRLLTTRMKKSRQPDPR